MWGKDGEGVATSISQVGGHKPQGTTGPALMDTVTQGLSLEWTLVAVGSPTQNPRELSLVNCPLPSGPFLLNRGPLGQVFWGQGLLLCLGQGWPNLGCPYLRGSRHATGPSAGTS